MSGDAADLPLEPLGRHILDADEAASGIVSPEGRLVAANAGWRGLTDPEHPLSGLEVGQHLVSDELLTTLGDTHGDRTALDVLRAALDGREPPPLRCRSVGADGPRWFACRAAPLGDTGQVLFSLRDVTVEEVEVAARDAVLLALGHDLRGPLTVVRGVAELLRRPELDDVELRADLCRRLLDRVDATEELLDALLDLNRTIVSRDGWELVPVAALVHKVVAATDTGERTIAVAVDDDLDVAVDPVAVERVLANLLSNAVEHTAPDTAVSVRVWRDAGSLHIEVADDGPGIDAAELVFAAFQRGATQRASGHGIGLTIVAKLVDLAGGTITLDNDRGTRIHVRLPAAARR